MLLEKIRNSKRLWIYGIGVVGKRILQTFDYFNIEIEGVLVSSMSGNVDSYRGIKVREFSAKDFDEEDLIIITAMGNAKEEIAEKLDNANVNFLIWNKELLCELWKDCKFVFEDRRMGKKKVCIVLSGYKEFLWENVFGRLQKYIPAEIEICLCSAGRYVHQLSTIAEKNSWSYLSTEINSVSLLQNISISLYPEAEWVYKMDEDMFVTKNMFTNMYRTAKDIIESKTYDFGLCSPLIPVNAVGYRYVLEKYERLNDYESKYGAAIVGGHPYREIERNPKTAMYMWGEGSMPNIDTIAKDMYEEHRYEMCNTRLSIGLILFRRELWEIMQGFTVYGNMDLGIDEEDINAFCINNSRVMAISMDAVAGHFGFGKQTKKMYEYYFNNKERF